MNLDLTYSKAQSLIFFESEAFGRYRIFPKGRRLGATRGAAHAFIEWMLEGWPLLWGDTINGNIDRYVERYFEPVLRQHKIPYGWHQQKRVLKVGRGYTDFRSADNPENWEGFGYKRVFLNEAGIILHNDYLYTNAVLPMLLDYPDSQLIAAGTPKLSQNKGLLFKELWDKSQAGEPGYFGRRFTTYDNPWLGAAEIETLAAQIAAPERPQEIDGRFVEAKDLGQYFKRSWFRPVTNVSSDLKAVRAWDLAATKLNQSNPDPDWTVGVKLAQEPNGEHTVAHVAKLRGGPAEVDALLLETARNDGPRVKIRLPLDPGSAGKVALEHYKTLLKGYDVEGYPQTKQQGSKAVRAGPASSRAEQGKTRYLVAPWNEWFFSQLEPFPNPEFHDDAVDAFAAAENELAEPAPQRRPAKHAAN